LGGQLLLGWLHFQRVPQWRELRLHGLLDRVP
jgi:hypothetical protein